MPYEAVESMGRLGVPLYRHTPRASATSSLRSPLTVKYRYRLHHVPGSAIGISRRQYAMDDMETEIFHAWIGEGIRSSGGAVGASGETAVMCQRAFQLPRQTDSALVGEGCHPDMLVVLFPVAEMSVHRVASPRMHPLRPVPFLEPAIDAWKEGGIDLFRPGSRRRMEAAMVAETAVAASAVSAAASVVTTAVPAAPSPTLIPPSQEGAGAGAGVKVGATAATTVAEVTSQQQQQKRSRLRWLPVRLCEEAKKTFPTEFLEAHLREMTKVKSLKKTPEGTLQLALKSGLGDLAKRLHRLGTVSEEHCYWLQHKCNQLIVIGGVRYLPLLHSNDSANTLELTADKVRSLGSVSCAVLFSMEGGGSRLSLLAVRESGPSKDFDALEVCPLLAAAESPPSPSPPSSPAPRREAEREERLYVTETFEADGVFPGNLRYRAVKRLLGKGYIIKDKTRSGHYQIEPSIVKTYSIVLHHVRDLPEWVVRALLPIGLARWERTGAREEERDEREERAMLPIEERSAESLPKRASSDDDDKEGLSKRSRTK